MQYDKQLDLEVIELLAKQGSDLTKPHDIVFYFYFPSKHAAQLAANHIMQFGCKIDIHPVPIPWWKKIFSKSRWTCLATNSIIPEQTTILQMTDKFNTLAAKYDGWETSIVQ